MTAKRQIGEGSARPGRLRLALAGFLLALAAALLVGAGESRAQSAGTPGPVTRVVAVDLDAKRDSARLVFTLSSPVAAKGFVLERPDRVIVDLPEVDFALPPQTGRTGQGFVASFRYGLFATGRSRIVIDLKEPALIERVESTTVGSGAMLVIELDRTDRATYHKAALKPMIDAGDGLPDPQIEQARKTAEAAKRDQKPVIVLDPGHGGVDPGAHGPDGLQEKDVVFAFAQRLRERLEAGGRYRVIMTRTSDTFVSLGGRVRIAREAGADLFISIHADTLSDGGGVRGATVYTGSEFATDLESAKLADKENLADQISGVEAVDDPDEVVGILNDLTKRETRAFSNAFAGKVIQTLQGNVKLNKNPHRSAGFRVLKAPDVPSVLIELGYLSSSKDAALLVSDQWRDNATAAIADAINRFFARRVAGQTAPAAAVSP